MHAGLRKLVREKESEEMVPPAFKGCLSYVCMRTGEMGLT